MACPACPVVRKGNISLTRGGSSAAAQIDKRRGKFLTSKSKYQRLVRSRQIGNLCTRLCLDPPVSAKKFIFAPLTLQDWKRHSAFRTDRSKPAVGIDRPKVSHVAMISSTGAPAIDQNQPVGRDATKRPVVCILGPSLNFTVYLPRTCLSLIFLISQSPI